MKNIIKNIPKYYSDTLIVGSGAAGLTLSLHLAKYQKITIISKEKICSGASFYAQGGIVSLLDETDNSYSYINDTLKAGDGLCNERIVKFIAQNANSCIKWLIKQGVVFDKKFHGNYHLTQEGGHSKRRILHCGDVTGKVIEVTLAKKAISHPHIKIMENRNIVDLITNPTRSRVLGAWIWNEKSRKIENFMAKTVVLATGGASRVYKYTTNPSTSSGDGIAIAWRAGCRVANLEFNQFHPTTLYHPKMPNFLLTESLRGEGALLKRADGTRFIQEYDSRGELDSRDTVTRIINQEIKKGSANCVYLDISHRSKSFISNHFSMIYNKLLELNIDLSKDMVPIIPAAHYTCGGVVVDRFGRTDILGLYAIGEVSYTGLHGANRIASNSLLECIVFGRSTAKNIKKYSSIRIFFDSHFRPQYYWHGKKTGQFEFIEEHINQLRSLMWNNVGIVRTRKQLKYALSSILEIKKRTESLYTHCSISRNLLELYHSVTVSELIVRCAIKRKESRGLHYILEYPYKKKTSAPSIIKPTI